MLIRRSSDLTFENQAISFDSEEEEIKMWGEEERAINSTIHNQKKARSSPHNVRISINRPWMDHQLSLSAIQGAQIKASV